MFRQTVSHRIRSDLLFSCLVIVLGFGIPTSFVMPDRVTSQAGGPETDILRLSAGSRGYITVDSQRVPSASGRLGLLAAVPIARLFIRRLLQVG